MLEWQVSLDWMSSLLAKTTPWHIRLTKKVMYSFQFTLIEIATTLGNIFLVEVLPQKGSIQSLTRVSISKNLEKKLLLNFSLARENRILSFLSLLIFKSLRTKFSFSSQILRFLRKKFFLFLIFEILKQDSLSLLDFQDFENKILFLFSIDTFE